MSLSLNQGTKPAGLTVQMYGFGSETNVVCLGDYEISLEDFLAAAKYVLTNTDLKPDDPRLQFVKCIQTIQKVDGYNPGKKRLKFFVLPIPRTETEPMSEKTYSVYYSKKDDGNTYAVDWCWTTEKRWTCSSRDYGDLGWDFTGLLVFNEPRRYSLIEIGKTKTRTETYNQDAYQALLEHFSLENRADEFPPEKIQFMSPAKLTAAGKTDSASRCPIANTDTIGDDTNDTIDDGTNE